MRRDDRAGARRAVRDPSPAARASAYRPFGSAVRERRFATAGRHRLRATDHPRTEHRTPNTEHRTPNTGSPPFIRPSPVRAKRPAASGRRAPPNFRQ
ncbi:hypothetical protein DF122_34335 [Burkholderia pseudomallei]|nr:hypothetical protein BOC35_14305 [Burkholderia pseudomallei]ARK57334.1 hypothetical protein BOC36_31135 [Burkholderia pseudomallei]ARL05365.1 hypothetical protein BOC44_27610 [Burkholderia pseudomallei]ARL40223.1 hypothetical protein BOC49_29755 [Burkholderia pseudomallei]MBG1250924.1 hypothetical protein [Burkholderia pseudomallei]